MSETATGQIDKKKKKSNLKLQTVANKEMEPDLHYCAKAIIEIVEQIQAQTGLPASRDAILLALSERGLKTRQPAIRLLYYWKRWLIDRGYLINAPA